MSLLAMIREALRAPAPGPQDPGGFYYVGVFLEARAFWDPYGFTSYVDCYVRAPGPQEASEAARAFIAGRIPGAVVTGTRPGRITEQGARLYSDPFKRANF